MPTSFNVEFCQLLLSAMARKYREMQVTTSKCNTYTALLFLEASLVQLPTITKRHTRQHTMCNDCLLSILILVYTVMPRLMSPSYANPLYPFYSFSTQISPVDLLFNHHVKLSIANLTRMGPFSLECRANAETIYRTSSAMPVGPHTTTVVPPCCERNSLSRISRRLNR